MQKEMGLSRRLQQALVSCQMTLTSRRTLLLLFVVIVVAAAAKLVVVVVKDDVIKNRHLKLIVGMRMTE